MMDKFCKCGCGQSIIIQRHHRWVGIPDYILGHNSRLEHPMQDRKHSEESCKKMRESHNPWQVGERHPMFGRKHSTESRAKMSKSHIGVPLSGRHCKGIGLSSKRTWASINKEKREEWSRKIGEGNRGKVVSEETKRKCSEAKKGQHSSPKTEFKKGMIPWMKGKSHTDESLKKNSEANKKRFTPEMRVNISKRFKELWKNPQYAKKCLSLSSPNKSELKLLNILNLIYPNEWKFVGDGQIIIAGKCPDFINTNGQKKIIELYGKLWHQNDDPEDRINEFRPFGYDTLIVWDRELNNKNKLKIKLQGFCETNNA